LEKGVQAHAHAVLAESFTAIAAGVLVLVEVHHSRHRRVNATEERITAVGEGAEENPLLSATAALQLAHAARITVSSATYTHMQTSKARQLRMDAEHERHRELAAGLMALRQLLQV
jgi:hypothetical protein